MMRRAAALFAAALVASGCARAPDGPPAGGRLVPLGGEIRLQRDGTWRAVTDTLALARGDRIEAGDAGQALIEYPAGTLELREGSRVLAGSVPELEGGSLLASAVSDFAVRIGDVEARAEDAVFRLDRDFALRVGVYRGEVAVPGSGWDGTVPGLRQVGVVAGTVPRGPLALQVSPSDPWDDRLLGEAIPIGQDLADYHEGVASALSGTRGRQAVAGVLPAAVDRSAALSLVPERAPAMLLSELLVASVVAAVAAPAHGVSPEVALSRVLDLRALGGSWIVVAAEWRLADSVVATLLQVVDLLAGEVAPPAAGQASGGQGAKQGAGSSGGGGGGGGGDGGGDPGVLPPVEVPECADLVTCTVEDVLEVVEDPLEDPLEDPGSVLP